MQSIIIRFSWLGAAFVLAAALIIGTSFDSASPASAKAKPGSGFEDPRELECILLGGETEWVFDESGYRGFVCRFADGMWWCPVDGECIRIILPAIRTEAVAVNGAYVAPQQHEMFGIGTSPGVRVAAQSMADSYVGTHTQELTLLQIDGERTDDKHESVVLDTVCFLILGVPICF